MEHRPLGRSGLSIAPIVLGGNVFGWTADEATSFAVLDAFVDAGFNAIDTADMYSRWVPGHQGGESETVIGRWLARTGRRDDVLLFTKVGSDMGQAGKGLSAAHIAASCEASLRRLQTDRIDLYQSHVDDPATPLDETMAAYARLIQAGKVRAIGASNFTADRLRASQAAGAAHGVRYESLQPHYNMIERDQYETELAPVIREENIGSIPYFALAAGFLTGKYRSEADLSKSPRGGSLGKYLNPRGLRVLAALDTAAAELGVTQAQVALAWLIARVTAPIASATSVAQWQDIARAATLRLPPATIEALDAASAPH